MASAPEGPEDTHTPLHADGSEEVEAAAVREQDHGVKERQHPQEGRLGAAEHGHVIDHKEGRCEEEKAGVSHGQVQEVGGEGAPPDAEAEEPKDGSVPHQPAQADEQRDAPGDELRDVLCKALGPVVFILIEQALCGHWGHCMPVMDRVVGMAVHLPLLVLPGRKAGDEGTISDFQVTSTWKVLWSSWFQQSFTSNSICYPENSGTEE